MVALLALLVIVVESGSTVVISTLIASAPGQPESACALRSLKVCRFSVSSTLPLLSASARLLLTSGGGTASSIYLGKQRFFFFFLADVTARVHSKRACLSYLSINRPLWEPVHTSFVRLVCGWWCGWSEPVHLGHQGVWSYAGGCVLVLYNCPHWGELVAVAGVLSRPGWGGSSGEGLYQLGISVVVLVLCVLWHRRRRILRISLPSI